MTDSSVSGSEPEVPQIRRTRCRPPGMGATALLLFLSLPFGTAAQDVVRPGPTASEAEGGDAAEPVSSPGDVYRFPAIRVADGPEIDGRLDDAVWAEAALITSFTQQEPVAGAPATEPTEVRVLYDGSTLFLGVHAFDSTPGGIAATEMRRDADRILNEDSFQVILDTFRDYRSAYMFVVTPLGAQLDQQIFDEGGRDRRASASGVNRDWDGVWSSSARRTDDGWIAEIAIPMVNLRFPDTNPQSWGINFMRDMPQRNEQVFWAPIPVEFGLTRVSLAGTMEGLQDLNRGYDLRIKPYATGGGTQLRRAGETDDSSTGDVGLDVKYGITPGLNLDLTYNTDFAQAEVDNEQVNLTRFPLFFPEKREFFLENAGQFAVGTTNSTGRIADLFFSRRIGIASEGNVPILGGARLTGKLGSNNIAVMDLQTDDAFGRDGENFLVARYSRDVFERSQIGGIFVNKQGDGDHYNRTYAADMSLVITPSLTIDGFLAATETPGAEYAEDEVAGHLRAGYLDDSWRIYAEHTDLGDGFNPEVGFVPRVGIRRSKLHFEFNPRPGFGSIRVMEPMANVTYFTDQSGRLVSRQFHYMVGTRFENGAYLNVMHNQYFERLDEPFRVASGISVDPGKYDFWDLIVSFSSNPSRRITYNLSYAPQTFWDGDRTDYSLGLGVRVTDQIATSARLRRSDVDLPAGDFVADVGSLQLDYALSPTVSLRTLTQYNSQSEQWSTSARFRWIYRPGSDLYIVYDEVRRDEDFLESPFVRQYRNRQLIVKLTYLVSM